MAAPALVALAHGSRDPRSAATIRALVDEVRAVRPDLKVEPAFLELSRPGFQTVVDRLVKAGHDEIVVVPLLLTEAHHATVDVPAAIAEATERHPQVRIQGTDVLGLETCFLQVLDERLREALREARVRELDALVLAAGRLIDSDDPDEVDDEIVDAIRGRVVEARAESVANLMREDAAAIHPDVYPTEGLAEALGFPTPEQDMTLRRELRETLWA